MPARVGASENDNGGNGETCWYCWGSFLTRNLRSAISNQGRFLLAGSSSHLLKNQALPKQRTPAFLALAGVSFL